MRKKFLVIDFIFRNIFAIKLIALTLGIHFSELLFAQYSSVDNNTGYWIDNTSWKGNLAPETSVAKTDVNIYGELISLNCLEFNLCKLSVSDTLIINGNIILQNKAGLYVDKAGVLIIFGDYTSKNKVTVNNKGTIIIVGNFEMLGSDLQGTFTNSGNVYIFDQSPDMTEDTAYNDLACIDTTEIMKCGYLTKEDFYTDRYYKYYSLLPFASRIFSEENNLCYELDFYSDKTRICPEEQVEFKLSSIGIESYEDIWWQFGIGAIPREAIGPGPHNVYYTSFGKKKILLTDKFKPELTLEKEIDVIEPPENITITKLSDPEQVFLPYLDQVCQKETSVYQVDGNTSSSYNWKIPSLNIDIQSKKKLMVNWATEPGEHLIFVRETNSAGCAGEISEGTVQVSSCKKNKEMYDQITYAFSPNGDNINDTWVIPGIEKYPNAKIYVFNKNGETLFVSENNYQNNWDGTVNGAKLPFDSYYYIIDLSAYQQKNIRGIVSIFW
jgi:gliding motility-associated-like protein